MTFLLDTSTCVEVMRRPGAVARRVAEHDLRELAVNAVVLLELERGVQRYSAPARERQRIDALLALGLEVLPFDADAARHAARVEYVMRAQPIGEYDRLIAAVALARGLTVVTRNVREFSRVPGLVVEDWGAPT